MDNPEPAGNRNDTYTLVPQGDAIEGVKPKPSGIGAFLEKWLLEGVMAYSANRLPARFPVGTKFVIEGRPGGDLSRFIEFPDGTKLRLPKRPAPLAPAGRRARTKSTRSH